jgi:pimeloyl-ACP methyl ester carboxylesterase
MDQFVDINGIRTRWRLSGSGPAVLVLHGWGAKIEAVDPIIRGLQRQTAVYAVDLPGHGETDQPPEPWGVTEFSDWTRALMDHLGLERPSIVGHSHGGRIAIHLAAHHPDRVDKLLLVDAAGIRPKRGLTYYRKVALAKTAKHAARFLGPPGKALQKRVFARTASTDYANAGALRPTFVKLVNSDLTPLLPQIRASTLLIWGDQDTATPLSDGETMERLIPDAGLVVLKGAGHFSYIDQPQRFGRVAAHFLAAPVPVA